MMTFDDAVARVRGRTITRRDISHRYSTDDPAFRTHHETEQGRLDQLIATALYEAAFEHADITAEDIDLHVTDEQIATAVESHRAWMLAALAVFDGEPLHEVYARLDATQDGERKLQRLVQMFDSREAILKSIERVDGTAIRRQLMESAAFEQKRRGLRAHIADNARAAAIPHEQFAERFWNQIIHDSDIEILDPRYSLISWRHL